MKKMIARREFLQNTGFAAARWPVVEAAGARESPGATYRLRLGSGCCAFSY